MQHGAFLGLGVVLHKCCYELISMRPDTDNAERGVPIGGGFGGGMCGIVLATGCWMRTGCAGYS